MNDWTIEIKLNHGQSAEATVKHYPTPSAAVAAFAKGWAYFSETGIAAHLTLIDPQGKWILKQDFNQQPEQACTPSSNNGQQDESAPK